MIDSAQGGKVGVYLHLILWQEHSCFSSNLVLLSLEYVKSRGLAQFVERLPSTQEVPSSIPTTVAQAVILAFRRRKQDSQKAILSYIVSLRTTWTT